MKESKSFIDEGIHPQLIVKGFRMASKLAREIINNIAVDIDTSDNEKMRDLLERCAITSLSSKLVSTHSKFFAKMVADAVLLDIEPDSLGIKKETGGSLQDSLFVNGVAFQKTFSYAGFEQQPKFFENPKILLLNVELELKAEKENAEIKINNPEDYQKFVDAEWKILFSKLEAIVNTGANVVLSRLAIGDLATQFFADRGIFGAGRVADDDMKRVCKATGGFIHTSTNKINPNSLGKCSKFEERQIGGNRYNFFTGCEDPKASTIILRGGGEQFIDEAERSLHDAIMIVRRTLRHHKIVGGGGAIEMELSKHLHDHSSRNVPGKLQMIVKAFAKALEVIPRQLSDNAGLDSTDVINQLRKEHYDGKIWSGVNLSSDAESLTHDTVESFVWEPSVVKLNSIDAATEAACMILSVDETIKNPKYENNTLPNHPSRRGMM